MWGSPLAARKSIIEPGPLLFPYLACGVFSCFQLGFTYRYNHLASTRALCSPASPFPMQLPSIAAFAFHSMIQTSIEIHKSPALVRNAVFTPLHCNPLQNSAFARPRFFYLSCPCACSKLNLFLMFYTRSLTFRTIQSGMMASLRPLAQQLQSRMQRAISSKV